VVHDPDDGHPRRPAGVQDDAGVAPAADEDDRSGHAGLIGPFDARPKREEPTQDQVGSPAKRRRAVHAARRRVGRYPVKASVVTPRIAGLRSSSNPPDKRASPDLPDRPLRRTPPGTHGRQPARVRALGCLECTDKSPRGQRIGRFVRPIRNSPPSFTARRRTTPGVLPMTTIQRAPARPKVRVAAVSYLNTVPMIEGLQAWRDAELTTAVPARLAEMVVDGR